MRYILTCILLCSFWGLGWGQVTRVEYFVDADPGLGQATAVSFAPGADISASFTVPLTTVSLGFHTLYVRTRDTQRRWSLSSQQAFYTTVLAPASQALMAAEYFIDQEPGLGQGTPIGLGAGQASATVSFNVGLSAVSTGFHTLYLRTRDAQGAWSLTQAQAFYVLGQAPASQALARAEYFIDQDPGLGSGTAIALPTGQQSTTLAFNIPLANVATGAHTLFVRAADRGKAWSLTQQQAFLVKPGGGLATITAFEYRFTGTGVNANYTSATLRYAVPTPAASVSLNFAADMSQLSGNADYDMHVWAVSSEGLRSLVQVKRVRACNTLPVKAGFDLAQDGRQVYFVNRSTNADRYRWSFGDGTTDTTANPLHTYGVIGNYTVQLISRSFCNPDTVTKIVSILGLKDITTNHGGNTGAVSVVVTGAGFVPGMQLKLQRVGQTDIVGDTVITRSVGAVTTGFDLTGKAVGQWNVVAVYPNGTVTSLPNGFTIEVGTPVKLWVSISGPSFIRPGFKQIFTLSYGNNGNTDAVVVPLFIRGLPKGTNIEILDSLCRVNRIPGYDTLSVYPVDSLKYTNFDSVSNTCYRILYIRKIAAGASGRLSVIFNVPVAPSLIGVTPIIRVSIAMPVLASTDALRRVAKQIDYADCFRAIEDVAADIELKGLISSFLNDWIQCGISVRQAADDINKYFASGGNTGELPDGWVMDGVNASWGIISATGNCAKALGSVLPQAKVARIISTVVELIEKADKVKEATQAAKKIYDACINIYPSQDQDQIHPPIRNSQDPNAKYGPGGGSAHHYTNKEAPLPYTIAFENSPTANLNAQTVRIVDTLSTQAFNFATFAFTSVTVGKQTYTLPAPAKSFVHDFDFVAQYGVKARVVGTFESATGIARWTFFSIDPVTNQVTNNALAGFLPPDVVSPKGQGHVSFTVQANAIRQTGDVIHNRASIIFDYNPPILTNDWHNTFDLALPTSAVTSVTATPVDSIFHINWSGTDVGSAIQSYDIAYTVNGHLPRTWLAGTSATTALFTGRRDSTYCFYSIARDSAGNVEAAPLVPDACKAIVLSQQVATPAVPNGFTIYPNPTPGLFTVEAYALKPEQASIQIVDVVGHVVYSSQLRLRGGTQRQELDAGRFASGIYFVKLSVNGKTVVRKLVKN